MAQRIDRIEALKSSVDDYVKAEQKRIDDEVQVLEAILNGRTGGAGVQASSADVVASVAQSDLAAYLDGS